MAELTTLEVTRRDLGSAEGMFDWECLERDRSDRSLLQGSVGAFICFLLMTAQRSTACPEALSNNPIGLLRRRSGAPLALFSSGIFDRRPDRLGLR
jgi:hypothetical protein